MQGFSPRPNKRAGILETIYYRKLSYGWIKRGGKGFGCFLMHNNAVGRNR